MPKVLPKTLNLLEPIAAPKSTWDKIYDWVFSAGRLIIILVEVVVLAAFASRFYYDRKNNDLKDGIEAKTQMLDAQKDFETEVKKTQVVLAEVALNIEEQYPMSGTLQNVLDAIPPSVDIDNFAISQNSVTMTCRAADYSVVQELENNFKADPTYAEVRVSLTRGGAETEVDFTVNLTFAGTE